MQNSYLQFKEQADELKRLYHETEELTAHNRSLLSRIREIEAGGSGGDVPMLGAASGSGQRPTPSRSSEALVSISYSLSFSYTYVYILIFHTQAQLRVTLFEWTVLLQTSSIQSFHYLFILSIQIAEKNEQLERLTRQASDAGRYIEQLSRELADKTQQLNMLSSRDMQLQVLDTRKMYSFISVEWTL